MRQLRNILEHFRQTSITKGSITKCTCLFACTGMCIYWCMWCTGTLHVNCICLQLIIRTLTYILGGDEAQLIARSTMEMISSKTCIKFQQKSVSELRATGCIVVFTDPRYVFLNLNVGPCYITFVVCCLIHTCFENSSIYMSAMGHFTCTVARAVLDCVGSCLCTYCIVFCWYMPAFLQKKWEWETITILSINLGLIWSDL